MLKKTLMTLMFVLFTQSQVAAIEYGGNIPLAKKSHASLKAHFCKNSATPASCKLQRIRVYQGHAFFIWNDGEAGGTEVSKWTGKNWQTLSSGGGMLSRADAVKSGLPLSIAQILIPTPGTESPRWAKEKWRKADLDKRSAWDLLVLRNYIYARHGRAFKHKPLKAYFQSMPWYKVNPKYKDSLLNATDHHNIALFAK